MGSEMCIRDSPKGVGSKVWNLLVLAPIIEGSLPDALPEWVGSKVLNLLVLAPAIEDSLPDASPERVGSKVLNLLVLVPAIEESRGQRCIAASWHRRSEV